MDPLTFENLGKQAARLAESGDLSLTDAVVQTIGHVKLNSEQVRRVVEQANVEAFNRKFASTSGSMRAVHIDGGPADPVSVLQALNDGARPREVTIEALEYSMPPEHVKGSSFSFTESFRTEDGVRGDIYSLNDRLRAAHDEVTQNLEAARGDMNEHLSKLAYVVKSSSLQGATAGEIFLAWSKVDQELAKLAYDRTNRLMSGGNTKVAGREINPSSAVVVVFNDFVKSAHSYGAHMKALTSIEVELQKVGTWIKNNRRAA
jgi:hypothetical protein